MPAPGALEVGRSITLSTTGSIQPVLARAGQLLGFWLSAAATVTLYDSATAAAAGAGNQVMPATVIAGPGWNFFPVDLLNGLCANVSAGTLTAVVC